MSVIWLDKYNILSAVTEKIHKVDVVLDIGCGIMPQRYVRPLVHICCEPFAQYVEHLETKTKDELDRQYIIIKAGWGEAVEKIPPGSVDSIFLIDVVEHLEKEKGLRFLELTKKIARKQIVLFTPLGFMPQEHPDGKDAWGLEGGTWQEHKSGWVPDDFDESWDIYACEDFHTHNNMGLPLEKPFGAFWAIKKCDSEDQSIILDKKRLQSVIDDVIQILKCFGSDITQRDFISLFLKKYGSLVESYLQLQQEQQALQQDYQALRQTRAVVLARTLAEHPVLMKLAETVYSVLSKVYYWFGGR